MQLPIPDDWDGVSTCTWAVCWPDSVKWKAILYGLIESINQGRLWDFETGNFLYLRSLIEPIIEHNFNLRRSIVSCSETEFNDLITVLNSISINVKGGGSCCGAGSRGAGEKPAPPSTYDETTAGGEPPPGFADIEEYDSHKCYAAWAIVNELGRDLQGLSALSYGGATIPNLYLAILAVVLTPIPYDDIIGLAALLIYTTVAYSFLSLTSAILYDNRFDLVCALYQATGELAAETALKGGISDLLDTETTWTASQKQFVLDAIDYFVGTDSINRLFEPVYVVTGEDDCQNCEEGPCDLAVTPGVIVSDNPGVLVVDPTLSGGLNKITVYFQVEETTPGQYAYCNSPGVTVTNITTTNNLLGLNVKANPDNELIDNAHFYPPNSNLPTFPYSNVGRLEFSFNTGQTGRVTIHYDLP